jgi:hypothetical protein
MDLPIKPHAKPVIAFALILAAFLDAQTISSFAVHCRTGMLHSHSFAIGP